MKIIFAGTPEFAKIALAEILNADFKIDLVLTQPDRPAGRGLKLKFSPVKELALEKNIRVIQPNSLRLDGKFPEEAKKTQEIIQIIKPDLIIVAAYGLILPNWILNLPTKFCLNIHASLLPRWRGAAPIHRSIEAGDLETGISIMKMDEELDTGEVSLIKKISILKNETTATLHDKLAKLGGELIVSALKNIDNLKFEPQKNQGITYAEKINKSESNLNWQESAEILERKIRAFDPLPGSFTKFNNKKNKKSEIIKIRQAETIEINKNNNSNYGQIVDINNNGIIVTCGNNSFLKLIQIQKSGGKKLLVDEFLRGFKLSTGDFFSNNE